jgi:hypothetical protein
MDERFSFWKWYKRLMFTSGAIGLIAEVSSLITGDLTSVLDLAADRKSTRVFVYQIVIFPSFLLFILMGTIGTIFCFSKIVSLVWTTSGKIAKLLRTDDRQLVFVLRRKMYAYISAVAFCCLLMLLEFNLLGMLYTFLCAIFLQIVLHFLEFVRLGVKNLDEFELREKSISDAVECEGVSQMASIEPISQSGHETDIEAKQKKWFK